MPEQVLDGDRPIDVGADEKNIPPEPPADPVKAPKGWRWDRTAKTWVARKRSGKVADADDGGRVGEPDEGGEVARPDSAWATGPDGRERDDLPEGPVVLTPEQEDDVKAILELFALPLLVGASTRDPYCGGALEENWERIRDTSLPLIARSPALVEFLTKAGGARDWLMFAAAVKPVATAVVRHHVTKTVVLEDDGRPREEDLSGFAA